MADTFNTPSSSPESEARIIEQQKAVQSIISKLDHLNGVFQTEQGGLWFASKAQKYSTSNYLDIVSQEIKKLEQEANTTHTTIQGLDAVQKTYFEMRAGIGDLYENTSTDLDLDVLYKILSPMNASEALKYLTEIHGKINSNTYQSDALKRRYKEVISTLHKQVLGKLETVEDKKTFFRIITGRNGGVSDDFKDTVLASQVLLEIENVDQSTKEMAANFRGEGWEFSDENTITTKNVAKWVGVGVAAVWGTVLAAPVVGATGLGAVASWGVAGAVGGASAATANNVAFGKWYESLEEASWDIGSQVALGAVLGAWGSRIRTIKGGALIGATGGVTETLRSATIWWQWLNDWKALAKGGGLGLGIALVLAVVTRGKWAMRIKWDQVVVEDIPVGTVAEVKDAINQAGTAATNHEGKKAAQDAMKGVEDALNISNGDYNLKGSPNKGRPIRASEDVPVVDGEISSKAEWKSNTPLKSRWEIAEGEFRDIFEYTHPVDKVSVIQNAQPGDVVRLKNAPWLVYQKQADGTWAQIGGNNRKVQRHNVPEQEVVGKMVKVADNRVLVLEREGEIVPQAAQSKEGIVSETPMISKSPKDIFEYTHPTDKAGVVKNAQPGDVVRLKHAPWLVYQKQANGTWTQIGGNNRKVQQHNVSEQEVMDKMVKVSNNRILVLERENVAIPQTIQTQEGPVQEIPTTLATSGELNFMKTVENGKVGDTLEIGNHWYRRTHINGMWQKVPKSESKAWTDYLAWDKLTSEEVMIDWRKYNKNNLLVPMTEGRSSATITPETSTPQWPQSMVDALGLKNGEYPGLKGSPNKGKVKTVKTERWPVPVSEAVEVPADVAKDPTKLKQFIKEEKEKAKKEGRNWWPLLLLLPILGLTLCSGPEENPVLTPVKKPEDGKSDNGGSGGTGPSGSENTPPSVPQQPRTIEEICQECDPNNPLSKLTLGRTNRLKQKIKLDESTRERITGDYMKTKKYQAFKHAWIDTPPKNQTALYREVVRYLQSPTMENIQAMQRCIQMKAVDTEEGQDGILWRRTLAAMITALSKECYPDKEKMDETKSTMLQKTQQEFSENDLLEPNLNSVPKSPFLRKIG